MREIRPQEPTGRPRPAGRLAEFGSRLKYHRRRAGLTQHQLGLRLGYHHTLISKWESGLREPPADLVRRLDAALATGGELTALVAGVAEVTGAPGRTGAPRLEPGLFTPLPGGRRGDGPPSPAPPAPAAVTGEWPARLSPDGTPCPLHGPADCPVPAAGDLPALLAEVEAAGTARTPVTADPDVVHGLTALLDGCLRVTTHTTSTALLGTVERVLRSVVDWARAADAAGRPAAGQLRLAARYAQLAGRLRMHRGQSAIAMAWFGHALRWADAADAVPVRATVLVDMSVLARLDGDAASALGYAQALAALDPRRGWTAVLGHLYQARGHALLGEGAESRHHLTLGRRGLARLGRHDLEEAPWLRGGGGELRIESAAGGALRDLSTAVADRAAARRAVRATARALGSLPPAMLPARLLLTVRLADCHACAGHPDVALDLAAPVVAEAAAARRLTVARELHGLDRRLAGGWGGLREVREFRERLAALADDRP
ncbi:helix-turn-helix domain-containing protein [Streptomyces pactum]|uniref:helix-turn-helix domain-containing protein n=1 Tax=Streptomyces pactum TaxID=68249 RepID=UPI0027DE3B13|nr:helix-turn-helix transcriptional regulator [Streptomyces pactum]